MNQNFWNRLRRVLLAIALSALALGLLVRWTVPAQASWAGSIQPGGSAKAVEPSEAALLAASIKLTKTVGTKTGICATDAITVSANAQVTYCYQATNTSSDITFTMHTLYEYSLDWTWSSTDILGPGESIVVTKPTQITQTTIAEAVWTAISGTVVTSDRDATTVTVAEASIAFTKTVGTDPTVCATDDTLIVPPGTDVTYCYKVTNTGFFTLTKHTLSDSAPGTVIVPPRLYVFDLGPGKTHFVTTTVTLSETTTNTATWTAYDALDNSVIATDTATVTVYTTPPTSQILWPQQYGLVTRTGTLTVTGIAWEGDNRPISPPDPVLDPIITTASFYYVTWDPVPSALNYALEESTDPYFSSPVGTYTNTTYNDSLNKYVETFSYTGKEGTYYYRLKAYNLSGESRWSNIQSVSVGQVSALNDHSAEPSRPLAPSMSHRQISVTSPITVWVWLDNTPIWARSKAVMTPEQTWWAWTAQVLLPETDYSLHTIQSYAQDMVGRAGPTDTVTIALDNRAPTSTITNLTPGQWISQPYTITGTIGDDQAPGTPGAEVRINNGEWITTNGSSTWWYLWEPSGPDGIYTITARAVDGVGNPGQPSDSITVTVDKPPAAPTGLTVLSTTAFSAHLTWTAVTESDVVSYRLHWTTVEGIYPFSQIAGLTTTYELASLRPATTYYLAVSAHDRRSEGPLSTPISATTGIAKIYLPTIFKRWPPVPYKPTLHAIANSDYDGNYVVSWSYDYTSAPVATYTLQEAKDAAFTTELKNYYPGGNTSLTISDAAPNYTYYYRVRGHNSYGVGQWSNVETVEVYGIPTKPVMNPIENKDYDGNYEVTWSSVAEATYYVLVEYKDDTQIGTYNVSLTSFSVTDKPDGIYSYCVIAANPRATSECSNMVSVMVGIYRDEFDDPSTGWAVRRYDDREYKIVYQDGNLYTLLTGSYDFAVTSPMVRAPSVPYTIKAKVRVVDEETIDGDEYWPKDAEQFGIIFGGNSGTPCPAGRSVAKYKGCLSHYYRLLVTWSATSENLDWNLKRIDYHDPDDSGKGKGVGLDEGTASRSINPDSWNTWEIRVTETGIEIYAEGYYLGETSNTRYLNDDNPYFGTFMASPQYGGVGFKWDWFEVRPQ